MYCVTGSTSYRRMNKLMGNNDGGDADSDAEDPEQLLNEWLGELNTLSGGLDPTNTTTNLRPMNSEIAAPRIDRYRFSMANLQDSQDVDLDAILGELCALETQCDREIGQVLNNKRLSDQRVTLHLSRTHSRSSSEEPRIKMDSGDIDSISKSESLRTDSPDNDSAFSDTVSMLSSESSASSGGSSSKLQNLHCLQDEASRIKAEKIRMAMEKIKEANIQKLFVKVFTADGSAKSLLVDEKMVCSYVTRLLMDKNHVEVDPKWAIVEHLPELYMERMYEDHELLVDNLMLWTRESKNKIFFSERMEKTKLFMEPEMFLLSITDKKDVVDYDDHSRSMLLEDFFTNRTVPEVEGSLYLKADSKKGWKKYYFVLRASGLYYFPKEKVKSTKDLVCLATFDNNQIYYGIGWKKKFKAPSDFCFAIKHPRLQEPKSSKYIKYLCAEDQKSLERWMVGMRIAKYGKQLMDNYRALMDELAQEDLDMLEHARSCSISSISHSSVTTPTQGYSTSEAGYGVQSETYSAPSESSSGCHSRASSSSSSGCMSDGTLSSCENAFDSEFPMGTIKRKPSMKPSLPLTNITRQLKEVGETRDEIDGSDLPSPVSCSNSGTLTRRHSRRKLSNSTDDSSNSGTLKRQHSYRARGSADSMGGRSGSSTPSCTTPVRERGSPFGEKTCPFNERSPSILNNVNPPNVEFASCMTDSITSLPPPPEPSGDLILNDAPTYQLPPPPPEVYNSSLSLDSLPPPPNPSELPPITGAELTGSQLSLMSLPPPPSEIEATLLRKRKGNTTPTNILSPDRTPTMSPIQFRVATKCVTFAQNSPSDDAHVNSPNFGQSICLSSNAPFNNTAALRSSLRQTSLPRQFSSSSLSSTNSSGSGNSLHGIASCPDHKLSQSPCTQRNINFQDATSPKKTTKKISFNLSKQVPPLPKKPPPPKRSDSTRLSSPKKLIDPPMDFLKDLQRVMRKKWQVAQKCKLEPTTTPHEVLGFRDPPAALPDYKEHNVSNWVQEHYGSNNLYENVYRENADAVTEYASSPVHGRSEDYVRSKRPPPPPPPKRSESTQLSAPKNH